MPEYIRALIFIIGLSLITFWIANKSLSSYVPIRQLKHWQHLWLATLLLAVASQDFVFFSLGVILLTFFLLPSQSPKRILYYLLLLCVLPLTQIEIPGFAGIRYLFNLDYSRLMIISLLIPLFISEKSKTRLFALPTDRFIVFFILVASLLSFRDTTTTNAIRISLLFFIDIFVPYFIISRHIKTHDDLKLL